MVNIDITSLKQYIYEHQKIEYILESLGCHSIKSNSKLITCGNPDGDNQKSIVVYNCEFLNTLNYTRNITDSANESSDLLTLVTYVLKQSNIKHKLRDTIIYLHKLLNLPYTNDYKKPKVNNDKPHPLDIFRNTRSHRKKCNVNDLVIYNEDEVLRDFINIPHIDLIREGIMPFTCEEFNIGYSPSKKRHIFPHRLWCGDKNTYVGVIGRTIIKEYEMLGISKYLPLNGKSYSKKLNLYGLNENYEYIQEKGVIVITEGEKSPLKRHSRGDRTVVSVGCHDISDEQARIILSLNVDVVICFDQDIDLQHIRETCEKFYNLRHVYYMYDRWGVLKNKESPCDKENKIYEFMFKHKIKYDEKEHREYLRCKD